MSSGPVRTDTKIIIPSSQGIAYRIGDLNDKRDAVLDDFAPSILELDMDTFIASLLPQLPALVPDIKQIMLKLISSGDLVMIDQEDSERFFWTAFATEPASFSYSNNIICHDLLHTENLLLHVLADKDQSVAVESVLRQDEHLNDRCHYCS